MDFLSKRLKTLDKMKFMGSWGEDLHSICRETRLLGAKFAFLRPPTPSNAIFEFRFRHSSPSGHITENKIRTFLVFLCHCTSLFSGCVLPASSSSSCLVIHMNFLFVDVRLAKNIRPDGCLRTWRFEISKDKRETAWIAEKFATK